MTQLFTEISHICKNNITEYHVIVGILQAIRDGKEIDPCVIDGMLELIEKHFIKMIKDYGNDNLLFSKN